MEISGKIIQVLPLQEGVSKSGNPWKKQVYILETQDQYPRRVAFDIFGDDKIKNNPCNIDEVVTVSFDLESREFNGRWYTDVHAWKVQQGIVEAAPVGATPAPVAAAAPVAAPTANVQSFDAAAQQDEGTDLPF